MSNLVLELKPGETMLINGAGLRFRNRTRVELTSRARFLFGKQIMPAHEAVTPWRRLYHALQVAYAGPDPERPAAMASVAALLDDAALGAAVRGAVPDPVGAIRAAIALDDCYAALRIARRMIASERLGATPPDAEA